MAFISLVFAFILLCVIGGVVLTSLIFLIVGLAKRKNGKRYPKVFIVLGLVVLIPFTVITTAGIVRIRIQVAENRKNLFYCVVNGEFDYAQRVIDEGASPDRAPSTNIDSNAPAEDGQDSLLTHFCGRGGDESADAVEFLIKNGADISRRTWYHEPDAAEHSGSSQYGYQMGDSCGRTPLMAAARSGSVRAVELLIEAGADVNATDYCGQTALMYAAASLKGDDSAQIAELLLENGADMKVVDHFGQNVWDHADYSGMYNVTDVLKQHAR